MIDVTVIARAVVLGARSYDQDAGPLYEGAVRYRIAETVRARSIGEAAERVLPSFAWSADGVILVDAEARAMMEAARNGALGPLPLGEEAAVWAVVERADKAREEARAASLAALREREEAAQALQAALKAYPSARIDRRIVEDSERLVRRLRSGEGTEAALAEWVALARAGILLLALGAPPPGALERMQSALAVSDWEIADALQHERSALSILHRLAHMGRSTAPEALHVALDAASGPHHERTES